MPTFQQVQTAAEQATREAMTAVGASWVFGNVSDTALAAGSVPWVKMILIEQTDSQMILGDTVPSRVRGTATFILHVRKNQGMGKHTQMRDAIKARFRSKIVGGATFLNSRSTSLGETDSWSLTGVEVPFYFDKHS